MNQLQQDPGTTNAIYSMLYGLGAVLVTEGVKVVILWLRGRREQQGRGQQLNGRISWSDREQLVKFIDDLRAEMKTRANEQKETDDKLEATINRLNEMTITDAQLRADLAIAKSDAKHANEHLEAERIQWASERQNLQAQITALKAQVAQLQKRGRA